MLKKNYHAAWFLWTEDNAARLYSQVGFQDGAAVCSVTEGDGNWELGVRKNAADHRPDSSLLFPNSSSTKETQLTAKNLDSDKCIMVIGAHAADAEIMGGATVLKHVDAGWRAVMVHMTPGEKGHPKLSPKEYKAIKDVEAENAAGGVGRDLGDDAVARRRATGE